MTAIQESQATTDLVNRMRTATLRAHEQLDELVMASTPFADRESYGRLLTMQYCLQRDFEPLYHDAILKTHLPDLESRSRLSLVEQDMTDLHLTLPANDEDTPVLPNSDLAAKIGWLFVLEGSRLGAASLFRRATVLGLSETFGARHLAGPAGGPAEKWRVFMQAISALPLNDEERSWAATGATAAFEHAAKLARRYVQVGKNEACRA